MGTIMDGLIIRKQGTTPVEPKNYRIPLSKILEICNKTIGFDLSTKYDGKEIKISNEINEE